LRVVDVAAILVNGSYSSPCGSGSSPPSAATCAFLGQFSEDVALRLEKLLFGQILRCRKVSTADIRVRQINSDQTRTNQICTAQIRMPQVRAPQIRQH
jgi:hypothetical protein